MAAATVGGSLFPGTRHTRTAPFPEPLRKPQLLKASGCLPVRWLVGLPGSALSGSGFSQRDFTTRLWPQLNSKFTAFFPLPVPDPRGNGDQHTPGPLSSAPKCPAQKLAALEGTVAWERVVRLQRRVRKFISHLSARGGRLAQFLKLDKLRFSPLPPRILSRAQGFASRKRHWGESSSGCEQSRLCLCCLLDYGDVRPGRTRRAQRKPERKAEKSFRHLLCGKSSEVTHCGNTKRFTFLFFLINSISRQH